MATFDTESIVRSLIAGNGRLVDDQEDAPDNPRATRIVEYQNRWGATAWGVVFEGEPDQHRYERATGYVNNPRVIWTLEGGER